MPLLGALTQPPLVVATPHASGHRMIASVPPNTVSRKNVGLSGPSIKSYPSSKVFIKLYTQNCTLLQNTMLPELPSMPKEILEKKFKNQPSISHVKRKMSKAHLGYVSAFGIEKINDGEMTEDDHALVFCTLFRATFADYISPYTFNQNFYKNDFIGWHENVKKFWNDLMGSHAGDTIVHFVSDDLKYVYVLHHHITTYMIGRINPDHELACICLRKFKRAKL